MNENLVEFVTLALECPGRVDDPGFTDTDAFKFLHEFDWINRCWSQWDVVIRHHRFDIQSFRRLIQIIVLAEREFNWRGGSVAAGIRLYSLFCKRYPEEASHIGDWIFRRRGNNPYMPLGTPIYKAQSWDDAQDYLKWWEADKVQRQCKAKELRDEQMAAAAKRREQHKAQAELHRRRCRSQSKKRAESLGQISEMAISARIKFLLNDWPLVFDAFPAEYLSSESTDYEGVSASELRRLRCLIGTRRRAWRIVKIAIDDALGSREMAV